MLSHPADGALLSLLVPQRLALLMAKERASDLEQLTEHLEAGQVVPSLSQSHPLGDTQEAMRLLEAGQVRGKLVIIPLTTDDE